jgi:hypothetical protein
MRPDVLLWDDLTSSYYRSRAAAGEGLSHGMDAFEDLEKQLADIKFDE